MTEETAPAAPRAARKRPPESRAYILMQAAADPELWFIVNRSGPSRMGKPGEAAAVRYDESSDDAAFDAMEDDAERRRARAPGRTIVAVLAGELPEFGLEIKAR